MKLFTTLCLIASVFLFLCWPAVIKSKPSPDASRIVRKQFAEKLIAFNAIQILAVIGAGVGAALIVRKARQEYRDQAIQNMRFLVEGPVGQDTEPHDG